MLRAAADRSGSMMRRGFRFETDAAGTMSGTSRFLSTLPSTTTNTGFRLTAIRDLFDRGHGRPNQPLEGSGPGGSIPVRLCFQWLSITMKTKARLFYLLLASEMGAGMGTAADGKIESYVISIAYRLSMAEVATLN